MPALLCEPDPVAATAVISTRIVLERLRIVQSWIEACIEQDSRLGGRDGVGLPSSYYCDVPEAQMEPIQSE